MSKPSEKGVRGSKTLIAQNRANGLRGRSTPLRKKEPRKSARFHFFPPRKVEVRSFFLGVFRCRPSEPRSTRRL
jgi:hypothetical protein